MIKGKKVLLGVTGSIAAYKAAILIRLLRKKGAVVKVIMTPSARDFITPLTLSTLSKNPVYADYYNPETGEWANHVALGLWADILLIAPCTANTLAKMAHGQCDNLLLATYLSSRCPVVIAPAMDDDMYHKDSTQQNIALLKKNGCFFINPVQGELASGLYGDGRMAEPETIAEILDTFFPTNPLAHKKILITAGPTYEPIDPVRFIGNYSSGKMGYAIAREAIKRGADVYLISGPVDLPCPEGVSVYAKVHTSDNMFEECQKYFPLCDVAILSAAVADFKPKEYSAKKIKKENKTEMTLSLVPTRDILAYCGREKTKQLVVGFALETENEEENARKKLKEKNADIIVLNSLNDAGAGMATDTNKITIFDTKSNKQSFDLKDKSEVASDILDVIAAYFQP